MSLKLAYLHLAVISVIKLQVIKLQVPDRRILLFATLFDCHSQPIKVCLRKSKTLVICLYWKSRLKSGISEVGLALHDHNHIILSGLFCGPVTSKFNETTNVLKGQPVFIAANIVARSLVFWSASACRFWPSPSFGSSVDHLSGKQPVVH